MPELYNLSHTTADLEMPAYLVASEEYADDLLGNLSVDSRKIYLVWAWTPLLNELQARYQAAEAELCGMRSSKRCGVRPK